MNSNDANRQILLSGIIYKINSIENEEEMRTVFLHCINALVPYQQATFYLAKKEGKGKLCDPVGINLSTEQLFSYFDYEEEDYRKWVYLAPKSTVFKESELYPEKKRNETRVHKELHIKSNVYYCLQISLVYDSRFLGVVSLYRSKEQGDFNDKEIFILDLIKDHLALRLSIDNNKKANSKQEVIQLEDYEKKYQLTKKELEVLKLIFDGYSNDEISGLLYISPNTLRKHLLHIYNKIGVSSRWGLLKIRDYR